MNQINSLIKVFQVHLIDKVYHIIHHYFLQDYQWHQLHLHEFYHQNHLKHEQEMILNMVDKNINNYYEMQHFQL